MFTYSLIIILIASLLALLSVLPKIEKSRGWSYGTVVGRLLCT